MASLTEAFCVRATEYLNKNCTAFQSAEKGSRPPCKSQAALWEVSQYSEQRSICRLEILFSM